VRDELVALCAPRIGLVDTLRGRNATGPQCSFAPTVVIERPTLAATLMWHGTRTSNPEASIEVRAVACGFDARVARGTQSKADAPLLLPC
jgi:hypothetical protein